MDIKLSYLGNPYPSDAPKAHVFNIIVPEMKRVVGRCEYRYEEGEDLYYYGHVGYVIYPPYRGHAFAYQACKKMFAYLYQKKGLHEYIITCNPDNIASKKTILRLNGQYLKTFDIPADHELFALGDYQKECYRIIYQPDE